MFKHGPKPRRMCRVLVAGHSSLDHIKGEISEGLGIAVREHVVLNTIRGHEVRTAFMNLPLFIQSVIFYLDNEGNNTLEILRPYA